MKPASTERGEHVNVLTLAEAARELRCSRSQLYNIRNGKFPDMPPLPVLRLGHRLMVRREALAEWLLLLERRELEINYVSGRFARRLPDDDLEYIAGA
jgi:hypothetical protein